MSGSSSSTAGPEPPSTEGKDYGREVFQNSNEPERIFDLGIDSDAVAIRANPQNGGVIYIGFDDQVTVNNGYPLEAGDGISVNLDIEQQAIWGVADTANDDVRRLVIG